ncbi:MAG: response regulator [Owenweeksia sp.]
MKVQEILLIDDDPIINFINKKIVEPEFPHYGIMVLENGLQALEYIQKNPQKRYLIFLDINMPVMNGWEFLKAISLDSGQYDLSIHILTSSIDESDKVKAQSNKQVLSYLPKPLTKDVLKVIK